MRPWLERYEQAAQHVLDGRDVIDRQHDLIARQKARGRNTELAEQLLDRFERSQAIFESDLARISGEAR